MDDVGDTVAGGPDGEPVAAALELCLERLELGLVAYQELDVVPGREPQIAATKLIGDVADVTDEVHADQTGGAHADGVKLGAALGNMYQNTGLQDFMILPLAKVIFDYGRHELVILGRTDVRYAVLHEIIWIKRHGFTS
jgi:hypothetical protein